MVSGACLALSRQVFCRLGSVAAQEETETGQHNSMFQPWDKYDSGAAAGAMSGPTNVHASSKFGSRMAYTDMEEVEMGGPPKAHTPKSYQSVNLKSGKRLDLP